MPQKFTEMLYFSCFMQQMYVVEVFCRYKLQMHLFVVYISFSWNLYLVVVNGSQHVVSVCTPDCETRFLIRHFAHNTSRVLEKSFLTKTRRRFPRNVPCTKYREKSLSQRLLSGVHTQQQYCIWKGSTCTQQQHMVFVCSIITQQLNMLFLYHITCVQWYFYILVYILVVLCICM